MKPLRSLYILLVVAVMIFGCESGHATPGAAPDTQTPAVFAAPVETRIPTSSITSVPLTATPSQTPTPTPPATLKPEQAEEIIRTLMREPVGCLAPCFWDIIPGQTTLDEAINVFAHLGLQVQSTTQDNKDFYGIAFEFDNGLRISPILTVQEEIVKNLRIKISPELNQDGVSREWLAYSPETLISQYGEPSRIEFFVARTRDGNTEQRTWYHLALYFQQVNLIIEYDYGEIHPEQNFRVCPLTDEFDLVRIWLGDEPEYPPFEGIDLVDAASMTIGEFSELMTNQTENPCFELNIELFP